MVETGTETLSFIVILEKSHLFRKDYAKIWEKEN